MKIEVEFPLVMKMLHTQHIVVSDPAKMKDVQEKVFECFWQFFRSYVESNAKTVGVKVQQHGSSDKVILKYVENEKEIIIRTDEQLQMRLKNCAHIQAVFDASHPAGKDEKKS